MLLFLFLIIISTNAIEVPCVDKNSVDISDGEVFHDGRIVKNGVTFPQKFVFTKIVNGEVKTFGCLCKVRPCFRKCCDVDSVMYINGTFKNCTSMPDNDIISRQGLNLSFINTFKMNVDLASSKFGLVHGRPCPEVYLEDGSRWFLQKDGRLYIMLPDSIPPWFIRGPEDYCIDTFVYDDPNTGSRTTRLDALICFAEKQEENHYILSSTGMLISCLFILATVAVYAWLPELQNLHGRVLVAYLMCDFVGFLLLAIMQILLTINNISVHTCLILTFVIYFFILASFFWLNIMCFDIWWTFSGKRGMSLEKLSIKARFIAYALYAFGIPTALTALLITLEFSGLPPHPLLPLIQQQGCFIYGTSKLLYLYGPITILCIANLTFFVLTAMKITQIKKQTSVLKSKESSSTHDQHRNEKQRLLLYVKLFVVMGFNWILEVISALYPDAEVFWRFTDTYNVLIGLIVFIIFVCKRKIFKLIKKRIKERRHRSSVNDNDSMKNFANIRMRQWVNEPQQRASLDTIRTIISVDAFNNNITRSDSSL